MVATTAAAPRDINVQTEFRGAVGRLFAGEASGEIVISGPAGTGKTRAILEWIHWRCQNDRIRVLLLRKTEEALKSSALVTYQEEVLYGFDGRQSVMDGVRFFGGNKLKPAQFNYQRTGSVVVVGGLDNPTKVASSRWDVVFINEVIEISLNDWESITGRTDRPTLVADPPPSLVLGDCNPGPPTHWIKQRESEGSLKLWPTTHKDNPAMWDRYLKQWTPSGERYLTERLDKMTGVRRARLRDGQWVAAEGQIYEEWSTDIHVIPPFSIPPEWPRYWCIDFGFVNPFVWGAWAIDPDGRLYLYREIYRTQRLVTEHAANIKELSKDDPAPKEIITDHDAEDRATFEKALGVKTIAAKKTVSPGLQAVSNRLKVAGDGKPRIFVFSNARVEMDRSLREAGKPTCTAEEYDSYVWDIRMGVRKGESPLKENDHGMDMTRYFVMSRDLPQPSKKIRGYN